MSRGNTFSSVYSSITASPAALCTASTFGVLVLAVFFINCVTSYTGTPRRVSLCLYSSNPFSRRIVLTISRMSGAVRYFVLNSCRRFSVSRAMFWARFTGTLASFMRLSAILLRSNSSIARREVRTSIFRRLNVCFSISSLMSTIILPKSVSLYFLVSTSGSMRSVLRRNLRW